MNWFSLTLAVLFAWISFELYTEYYGNYGINPSPIVNTEYGKIQGSIGISRDGRTYYQYFAIPYAKAPIGTLRFESPEKPVPWAGLRTAYEFGNECAQFNMMAGKILGKEDCLFLNVFTPKLPSENKQKQSLFPVMVFVHGGGYVFGSANMYGPQYFIDEDVVIVTINYRLASLGFVSTNDGLIRGNMGMKDQVMTLQWVNGNIANFNGDPNKVTLFGESAGGCSVNLHMFNQLSKGLFHGVISQSGSALSAGAVKPSPEKQLELFSRDLNCKMKNTQEMVKCLKEAPIENILKVQLEDMNIYRDQLEIFGPTIETIKDNQAFLTEVPYKLIVSGKTHKVPIMLGYNSNEGVGYIPQIVNNESLLANFADEFAKIVPNLIFYPVNGKTAVQVEKELIEIQNYYMGRHSTTTKKADDDKTVIEAFTNLATDFAFAIGTQDSAKLHAINTTSSYSSPVYLYYYTHEGEFQFANYLLSRNGIFNPPHKGAGHVDELALLFKLDGLSNIKPTDKDYLFSKELVKLWASFAKGEELTFKGYKWIPIESQEIRHFELNNNTNGYLKETPNAERIEFLRKYHTY